MVEAPTASGPRVAGPSVGGAPEIASTLAPSFSPKVESFPVSPPGSFSDLVPTPLDAPPDFTYDIFSPQTSFKEFLAQTRPINPIEDKPSDREAPKTEPSLDVFEKAFREQSFLTLDPDLLPSSEATTLTLEKSKTKIDINPFHQPDRLDPHFKEGSGAVEEAMKKLQQELDQKILENPPKTETLKNIFQLSSLDQKLGEELSESLQTLSQIRELPHIELEYPDFTFKPEKTPGLVEILTPTQTQKWLNPSKVKIIQKAIESTPLNDNQDQKVKKYQPVEELGEKEEIKLKAEKKIKIDQTLEDIKKAEQAMTEAGFSQELIQEAISQIPELRNITAEEPEAYAQKQLESENKLLTVPESDQLTKDEQLQKELEDPQPGDSIVINGVRHFFVIDRETQQNRNETAASLIRSNQEGGRLSPGLSEKLPESDSLKAGITKHMPLQDGTLIGFKRTLKEIDELAVRKELPAEQALNYVNTSSNRNVPVTLSTSPIGGVGVNKVEEVLRGAYEMNVLGTPSNIILKSNQFYRTRPKS